MVKCCKVKFLNGWETLVNWLNSDVGEQKQQSSMKRISAIYEYLQFTTWCFLIEGNIDEWDQTKIFCAGQVFYKESLRYVL